MQIHSTCPLNASRPVIMTSHNTMQGQVSKLGRRVAVYSQESSKDPYMVKMEGTKACGLSESLSAVRCVQWRPWAMARGPGRGVGSKEKKTIRCG